MCTELKISKPETKSASRQLKDKLTRWTSWDCVPKCIEQTHHSMMIGWRILLLMMDWKLWEGSNVINLCHPCIVCNLLPNAVKARLLTKLATVCIHPHLQNYNYRHFHVTLELSISCLPEWEELMDSFFGSPQQSIWNQHILWNI